MKDDLEHVVIRRVEFVAGTKEEPEASVYVQANRKKPPLKTDLFRVGQVVWMKWSGGPIVARSRILSWQSGTVVGGDVSEVRDKTKGTGLHDKKRFWEFLADKGYFHFTVVRLTDEELLETPIHSTARSFGSSWIYLRNQRDKKRWLVGLHDS
ncbi:MAG: hypothetical protein KAW39_00875 [Thermoplasmata archaeon]|nr:hypothetical protein [Thermoplasmata archaeon]